MKINGPKNRTKTVMWADRMENALDMPPEAWWWTVARIIM